MEGGRITYRPSWGLGARVNERGEGWLEKKEEKKEKKKNDL